MDYFIDYEPIFKRDGGVKGYILTARIPNAIPARTKVEVEDEMVNKSRRFFAPSIITHVFSHIERDMARVMILLEHSGPLPTDASFIDKENFS